MPDPRAVPRPDWSPLPMAGCINVEGKVLLVEPSLVLALLRFQHHGTIHEHSADFEIDVICLDGEGFTSVDAEIATLAPGRSGAGPPSTSTGSGPTTRRCRP